MARREANFNTTILSYLVYSCQISYFMAKTRDLHETPLKILISKTYFGEVSSEG